MGSSLIIIISICVTSDPLIEIQTLEMIHVQHLCIKYVQVCNEFQGRLKQITVSCWKIIFQRFPFAGALWSFTNMAGSVAHNLEALSLDNEHSTRALNARRSSRNKGLAQGVQSGLSEFGLSLLGAFCS